MRQSLKVKFLVYISVLIICAMGISTGIAYISSKDVVRKAIMQQLSQLSITTSEHIAFWIRDRKQDLVNWGEQQLYQTALDDSYLGRAARQSASSRLKELRHSYGYYESLNLVNTQGEVLSSSDEKVVGRIISNQQFFQESLKGNVYLSSVMKSPDTAEPVFIISVPVRKAGTVEGVFYGIVDSYEFSDLFITPIQIGKTGYAYVIGPDGAAVAHPDKNNILNINIAAYDWGKEMMQRKQGFIIYVWNEVKKIAFFHEDKDSGWLVGAAAGLNEIFAPVRRLQLVNLFITIIFIIIAVISVSLLYNRIILRPMGSLVEGIVRFGQGDFGKKIELATKDEFNSLAEAFNTMTDNLQKITVSRDDLVREVGERKRAEEELKKAYDKLKAAEFQLVQTSKMASIGQLAGGVAHEINNPLTGVLNNVQLIKMMVESKKDFGIDEFRELLGVIEESAVRCKNITGALLSFSHAASGQFQPVPINEIIEKIVSLIAHEMRLQNISVQTELEQGLVQVNGDAQLLQQVIFDIISNAKWAIQKKSEKKGGTITINTHSDLKNKQVLISITDTGIGIPKESLDKIFEPFFTTKPVGEGTGLGLSITYSIVKAHQGLIMAESQIGQGTTFKILLPLLLE